MDRESFKRWLDSYGQAWKGGYPQAHAAAYQVTPFSEPIRRREAIDQYSDGVEKTEERIQFEYEVLVVTDAEVIARWRHLLCGCHQGLKPSWMESSSSVGIRTDAASHSASGGIRCSSTQLGVCVRDLL